MPIPINLEYSETADQNAYQTYAQTRLSDVLGATWDTAVEFNPSIAAKKLLTSDDETAPTLTAKDANDKYAIGDLRFDGPVLQSTAKRLYDAKYGEIKRSEIINRGPQGFMASAAKFGTTLAASAIDPLNIASAFFPSFALGKTASLLGMAEPAFIAGTGGSIAARAAGGAAEGAIGAAVIEPLPYLAAKKDHLEYGLGDSLLNIAVGGVLGGGLHALARGLEIRGETIRDRKITELSKTIDTLPPESKMRLMQSAFSEISEGQFPHNAANILAREIIANQPHGLTDFTFRLDGSLSMENQQRLMKRAGAEAVGAIPVERFESRAQADAFIRGQDDRMKYLTQKDDATGGYVVAEIKPAAMLRDGAGQVQRFNSYEEAAQAATEVGNGQPVGFVKDKGKSAQNFVVIKGISPEDAHRLQGDASFAEFYDPTQGAQTPKTRADTATVLQNNGINLPDVNVSRDLSNDMFIEPPTPPEAMLDYGKTDGTVESVRAEADTAIQMLNDLYPEMSAEYSAILEGVEEALSEAKVAAQGWKYLGNCMLRNQ